MQRNGVLKVARIFLQTIVLTPWNKHSKKLNIAHTTPRISRIEGHLQIHVHIPTLWAPNSWLLPISCLQTPRFCSGLNGYGSWMTRENPRAPKNNENRKVWVKQKFRRLNQGINSWADSTLAQPTRGAETASKIFGKVPCTRAWIVAVSMIWQAIDIIYDPDALSRRHNKLIEISVGNLLPYT